MDHVMVSFMSFMFAMSMMITLYINIYIYIYIYPHTRASSFPALITVAWVNE